MNPNNAKSLGKESIKKLSRLKVLIKIINTIMKKNNQKNNFLNNNQKKLKKNPFHANPTLTA